MEKLRLPYLSSLHPFKDNLISRNKFYYHPETTMVWCTSVKICEADKNLQQLASLVDEMGNIREHTTYTVYYTNNCPRCEG